MVQNSDRYQLNLLLFFLDVFLFIMLRSTRRVHHGAIRGELLLLRLVRSIQNALANRHVIRVLRLVGNLEMILLTVNSHIILACTHKVGTCEVFEILLKFADVYLVKRAWSFELTYVNGIHGFHLRLLSQV